MIKEIQKLRRFLKENNYYKIPLMEEQCAFPYKMLSNVTGKFRDFSVCLFGNIFA